MTGSIDTIIIGCVIGVVSSATQSIGLTLQRKSHLIEDSRPPGISRRAAHRQGLWRVGLILFLLSNVFGSSVQITTLPIVILSPLQAVGLVFNSICASLVLSEPFTRFSIAGTVLVSMGALLIAAFGAVPEPEHNLNELLHLLHRKPFLVWMACTFVVIGLVYGGIRLRDYMDEKQEYQHEECYHAYSPTSKGILYGVISGILSAHSLLMAKSAVELLVRGFRDKYWADYFRWQSWMIIAMFLFFALSQLYVLNCGLRLCSTSVLYPLVFCVYNITAILNGLIYFEQTSRLTSSQICLVALGTCLVLFGVLNLSWRLDKSTLQSYSVRYQQQDRRQNTQMMSDDPNDEHQPLLVNTSSIDDAIQEYTSFRTINTSSGTGIPEPISPFSAAGNRHAKVRTLSSEQAEIMEQLRRNKAIPSKINR